MKKIVKISLISLLSLVGALLLAVAALNLLKFAIYSDYYAMESELCKNPGLSDGFICQGICVSEDEGKILVSGYMVDGGASRIYVTDCDDNSYFVELSSEGEPFLGHAGGIALTGDTVYISSSSRLFVFSLSALLATDAGEAFDIGEGTKVNCAASFVYADESYVYVGEFNDPKKTQKKNIYETPNGTNHSIVERYRHGDLENPDKVYSIIDYVQGVCFTPDGRIVFSTSYGLTSTGYYVYDESDTTDSGNILDGAPVYFLGDCIKHFKGPAMGEDLDWTDGKLVTLTESASNKYVFGKFFFADDIVMLDIGDKE